ncbi:transcobalamin-2 [Amia ocellicauda]|uniref:transcobalamin-2 n=1 Tax=Amia ocellicauda TaxID=2972642 RepID=UPI003464A2A5
MALTVILLLSSLLLLPGLLANNSEIGKEFPVKLIVQDTIHLTPDQILQTTIPYRAILLGAMRKISEADPENFRFEIREDTYYGPFLVSVNGVAGNDTAHTYWELLKEPNTPLKQGVGCYIPEPNETIILRFTTWD